MKKLLLTAVIALSMAACEPEGDLYVISSVSVSPISGDVGTEFEWQAEVSTLVASELTVTLKALFRSPVFTLFLLLCLLRGEPLWREQLILR